MRRLSREPGRHLCSQRRTLGWAAHFESYLASQGKHELISREWPIRRVLQPIGATSA